jgi:hypothetical protein
MQVSRRTLLSVAPLGMFDWMRISTLSTQPTSLSADRHNHILRIVREYADQGLHRTGTTVDRISAEWLADRIRQIGLRPSLEPFSLRRVDPITAAIIAAGHRVDGLPLFDAAFTDADGVRGQLGRMQDATAIGLTESLPNPAGAGALGDARRQHRHRALVIIARGARPSPDPCPSNADMFEQPFGPPAVQVGRDHQEWLAQIAAGGGDVQVVAHVQRTPAEAFNVVTSIEGEDRSLPALVVMTPRSGWYSCASERGGGIVCWLELMARLRAHKTRRSIHFVASSGHELGHLGIDAYMRRRPALVKNSVAWIHLGANLGAAVAKTGPGEGNTIQASDQQLQGLLKTSFESAGVPVHAEQPVGSVPGGEAEAVHRGGGRYVSAIGRNALFHHINDRGDDVVDPVAIARFADAFGEVAEALIVQRA